MFSTIALITALTSPLYKEGTDIKVIKGPYKDCIGTVLYAEQPPKGDIYALALTKCPTMYIKGKFYTEGFTEDSLEAL